MPTPKMSNSFAANDVARFAIKMLRQSSKLVVWPVNVGIETTSLAPRIEKTSTPHGQGCNQSFC